MSTVQLILSLIGLAAKEVEALTKPGSVPNQAAILSDDLLQAIAAVTKNHQDNGGKPIADVLATL